MGRASDRRPVTRVDLAGRRRRPDTLVGEEPLEIRVGDAPFAVTMRTPGEDVDLALGLLRAEAAIAAAEDVAAAKHCSDTDYNVLEVTLRTGVPQPAPRRATSSACGACGYSSLDVLWSHMDHSTRVDLDSDRTSIASEVLLDLPRRLRERQRLFERTGGLHAAGVFAADGSLECVREDVGRHNATDKAVGWALREGRIPLTGRVLAVSGRVGAEIVQKAAMAGFPMLAAVSAPSTLAVDLAEKFGMTLAGFIRNDQCNVYTHPDRVLGPG